MVEVDPRWAVVGAAGGVPLIDTFEEPVAALCVWARWRGRLSDIAMCRPYPIIPHQLIFHV
jgi:hypothetical protein